MALETFLTAAPLALALLVFVIQLADANAEYSARSFIVNYRQPEWWIHNDEKTILPESRSIFLRKSAGTKVSDFGPWPVSAAFGIASTALNLAGFSIFGLNAAGLRFFYMAAAAAANMLFILSAFHIMPPTTAFITSLFLVLNYRSFLAGRHAYPENILSLILALLVFMGVSKAHALTHNLPLAAFLCGAAVLVKPNYPLYAYMLLGSFATAWGTPLSILFKTGAAAAAGLLFFEAVHWAVLAAAGTLPLRVQNLLSAIRQHRGLPSPGSILKNFPDGAGTAPKYLHFFLEWFETPAYAKSFMSVLAAGLFAAPAALFLLGDDIHPLPALFLAHLLFLAVSSMFFFYLKRAYSWFPVTILLLAATAAALADKAGGGGVALDMSLAAALAVFVARQSSRLRNLSKVRAPPMKDAAGQLEKLVPPGSIVYAHCFSYRRFWQSEKLRFKSCDDQMMDNANVAEWALREGGEYLLLASRDCGLDSLPRLGVKVEQLAVFRASAVESDYPESHALMRIARRPSAPERPS